MTYFKFSIFVIYKFIMKKETSNLDSDDIDLIQRQALLDHFNFYNSEKDVVDTKESKPVSMPKKEKNVPRGTKKKKEQESPVEKFCDKVRSQYKIPSKFNIPRKNK